MPRGQDQGEPAPPGHMKFMNATSTSPAGNNPRILSSKAAGYLLHKPVLFLFAAFFLIAVWNNQTPIVLLMSLFLSAAFTAKGWSRLCLVGVTCRRVLSECRVFPGEKVEVTLHLANRKLLPLPWIQVEDRLPEGLTQRTPGPNGDASAFRHSTAMLWYRSVRWTHDVTCERRGYYPFGPIEITSGDIFGLYTCSRTSTPEHRIIVYPKIYPVSRVPIPSVQPMGNSKSETCLFQDPTRAVGVREYRVWDGLRHIHWKASARAQELQVKVFEPSTTFKIALFLAVDSFHREGTFRSEEFELGISAAASIAHHVIDHGGPAGLFSNTCLADSGHPVIIPPSGDRGQLAHILEALAKTTSSWDRPFGIFLERERRSLPAGTTLVFTLSSPTDDFLPLLLSLKGTGYKILVLFIGEQGSLPVMEGIPWIRVRGPKDLLRA